MHTYGSDSKLLLPAVRKYILLLVGTVTALLASSTGYLYWRETLQHRLEAAANHYHLQTVLLCAQIKEEMVHIRFPQADDQLYIRSSQEQGRRRHARAQSGYLIEKYVQEIMELQESHAETSDSAPLAEPVLDKARRQLAGLKVSLNDPQTAAGDSFRGIGLSPLDSFWHSIEQLRRLHIIARGKIINELSKRAAGNRHHFLITSCLVLLLGSLIVWKILREIRSLVEAQRQTESLLRQAATFFESASEGVLITDVDTRITAVNRAFTEMTGYSEDEVLGRNPRILKSGRHNRDFYKTMWAALLQEGEWRGEIWGRRKSGEVFPKWQTIRAVRDDSGGLTHYMSVFSDVSHIKESEEKLHRLAHHDALTDLPNRLLLNARLEYSLQHAQRTGAKVAVLFLDLDHFKKINDSLGHPAGDRLLQLVAERLLLSVRTEDTVARLGGDELTVVLGSLEDAWSAAATAQEILTRLSEPYELEGQDVFVSASIGISMFPDDGRDVTALLKNADAAMYMAKSEGRNRYHFYSRELTSGACESLALETELHHALERGEFFLQFQPQISVRSGDIVAVEALLRWRHPEIGLISPVRFIPIAEESGFITAIGRWVLRSACEQAKAWQIDGLTSFRIAVNLSGRQFGQTNIVQEVREALTDTGLDPSRLELELTESAVMKQEKRMARTLHALRELGTTIAIDDFGTGYSSLSYLKRYPFDRLKIDRSFVRDIPRNPNDVAFAKAIVALGHSLDLSVVAEGVETREQRDLLTSIGCDEMQGFLYSAPRNADELAALLSAPIPSACVND